MPQWSQAEDRLDDRRDVHAWVPGALPQWSQPKIGWMTRLRGLLAQPARAAMEPAEDRLGDRRSGDEPATSSRRNGASRGPAG